MEKIYKHEEKACRHGLTRRAWVQRIMAGAGAGIAAPVLGGANSGFTSLESAFAARRESADDWKPAFFNDHQNLAVVALAEKIVPGSTALQVNRFIDLALDAETQDDQRKFVSSLNAIEGESLRRYGRSFTDISASQQDEILTAASNAQSFRPDLSDDAATAGAHPSAPSLRDYFDHLKDWIRMAYYSTEDGMKELGWTGENFFESYPGCEHAGGHS
jgi:hypothetical protein